MTLTKAQTNLLNPQGEIFSLLGILLNDPKKVLDRDVHFDLKDFPSPFHKVVWGAIDNLVESGIQDDISELDVMNYLGNFKKSEEVFNASDGVQQIHDMKATAKPASFKRSYQTVKKYSILREYVSAGVDISDIFPINSTDIDELNEGAKKVESMTPDELTDYFSGKVLQIKNEWREKNSSSNSFKSGDIAKSYIEKIQKAPDYGFPFIFNGYYNSIYHGMRSEKLLIKSAGSGVGKSRTTIMEACGVSCSEYFDTEKRKWVNNAPSMPTLVISSELDEEEITNLTLAFVTGISSRDILKGKFTDEEKQRLKHGAEVLEEAPLYFEYLTEYSSSDVSMLIEQYVILKNIKVCFFDYIMGNPKLQFEFKQAYGSGLREDQVLVNFSKRLKEIATDLNLCIIAGSQTNAAYLNGADIWQSRTSNAVRGSRSIIDKADGAEIMAKVTSSDIDKLQKSGALQGAEQPNYAHFIYKNRADESDLIIFTQMNLGTMREKPMFVTDYNYNRKDSIKPLYYSPKLSNTGSD